LNSGAAAGEIDTTIPAPAAALNPQDERSGLTHSGNNVTPAPACVKAVQAVEKKPKAHAVVTQ